MADQSLAAQMWDAQTAGWKNAMNWVGKPLGLALGDKAAAQINALVDWSRDPKGLSDAISRNLLPQALVDKIVKDLKDAQNNLDTLWNDIQFMKKLPAAYQPPNLAALEKIQQERYASWNANVYILWALPSFAKVMKGWKIRAPNTQTALAASPIARQINAELKRAGGTGDLSGLGEGLTATAIAVIVAGVLLSLAIAAAADAYMAREASIQARAARDSKLAECIAAGKCPANAIEQAHTSDKQADDKPGLNPLGDIGAMIPWIVGGVALIALLPLVSQIGRSGASVLQSRSMNGLGYHRAGRTRRMDRW